VRPLHRIMGLPIAVFQLLDREVRRHVNVLWHNAIVYSMTRYKTASDCAL